MRIIKEKEFHIRFFVTLTAKALAWILSVAGLKIMQYLLDPTSISRRDMRNDVNIFMQTVTNEAPLDASLVDFEDDESC